MKKSVSMRIEEGMEVKLSKSADKTRHKIIIPSFYIKNYGYDYQMICTEDQIILKPISLAEEED